MFADTFDADAGCLPIGDGNENDNYIRGNAALFGGKMVMQPATRTS